jgi:hypothetical protein
MSEGEKVRPVIKEFLSVTIFLITLFNALVGVIADKLIAFAHQELILAAAFTSNLVPHALNELFFLISLVVEISLGADHFVLNLFEVLTSNLSHPGHLSIEIDTLPEPLMHTILPHAWESCNGNSIPPVGLHHLCIGQAGVGQVTWLRIWVRHVDEQGFA